MKRYHKILSAGFLFFSTVGLIAVANAPGNPLSSYAFAASERPMFMKSCVRFDLATGDASHSGLSELAVSTEETSWGMMYRRDLPDWSAMIFDMQGRNQVKFWMKNTPSSLDIAFFDTTGQLAHIEKHTTPLSEMLVGPAPDIEISYVLEVPAGRTSDLNLIPGETTLSLSSPFTCPRDFS